MAARKEGIESRGEGIAARGEGMEARGDDVVARLERVGQKRSKRGGVRRKLVLEASSGAACGEGGEAGTGGAARGERRVIEAWRPVKGRYLLALCTYGRLSNQHSTCTYVALAALLNRTIIIPRHGFAISVVAERSTGGAIMNALIHPSLRPPSPPPSLPPTPLSPTHPNQQEACMHMYLALAALLNRTLIIPRHGFAISVVAEYRWQWGVIVNVPHMRSCLVPHYPSPLPAASTGSPGSAAGAAAAAAAGSATAAGSGVTSGNSSGSDGGSSRGSDGSSSSSGDSSEWSWQAANGEVPSVISQDEYEALEGRNLTVDRIACVVPHTCLSHPQMVFKALLDISFASHLEYPPLHSHHRELLHVLTRTTATFQSQSQLIPSSHLFSPPHVSKALPDITFASHLEYPPLHSHHLDELLHVFKALPDINFASHLEYPPLHTHHLDELLHVFSSTDATGQVASEWTQEAQQQGMREPAAASALASSALHPTATLLQPPTMAGNYSSNATLSPSSSSSSPPSLSSSSPSSSPSTSLPYAATPVLSLGDLNGLTLAGLPFDMFSPHPPFRLSCVDLWLPPPPVEGLVTGFIDTFLGGDYAAVHLRRSDFARVYRHAHQTKSHPAFLPIVAVGRFIMRRLADRSVTAVYLATDASQYEVELLERLLMANARWHCRRGFSWVGEPPASLLFSFIQFAQEAFERVLGAFSSPASQYEVALRERLLMGMARSSPLVVLSFESTQSFQKKLVTQQHSPVRTAMFPLIPCTAGMAPGSPLIVVRLPAFGATSDEYQRFPWVKRLPWVKVHADRMPVVPPLSPLFSLFSPHSSPFSSLLPLFPHFSPFVPTATPFSPLLPLSPPFSPFLPRPIPFSHLLPISSPFSPLLPPSPPFSPLLPPSPPSPPSPLLPTSPPLSASVQTFHEAERDMEGGTNTNGIARALAEKHICARAKHFIGTPYSSYSKDIFRMREVQGLASCADAYIEAI
ncbi:unnamed protein product [Closterium sp. NIES-65]|nr:unnamed protein product [Closterium sp. NIES-65]